MGVVIIPFFIEAADADAPAAVLVPAQGLHGAGFHGDDGSSHLAHHVVAQMAALVAVGAGNAEVVIVAVWEVSGDGGKGLEPVFGDPGPGWIPGSSLFWGSLLRSGCFWRGLFQACLLFKIAHHAAQDCAVGFFIIGIIFQALRQRIQVGAVF